MKKLIKEIPNLLIKQRELDLFIYKNKNIKEDEIMEEKKLAFMVELAECANEWRGFKYWSKNRNPNNEVNVVTKKESCCYCGGIGWKETPYGEEDCHYCEAIGYVNVKIKTTNRVLSEFVDVLHFALSIHNYYAQIYYAEPYPWESEYFSSVWRAQEETPLDQFTRLYKFINDDCMDDSTGYLILELVVLADTLGLSADEILEEYNRKYKENISRQKNGY